MDILSIIIIAIGLSADSFAVSVSNGFSKNKLDFKYNFLTATSFALFQAGMPLLGWLLGNSFAEDVKAADHWIAFGLLSLIGIKMIYESFNKEPGKETKPLKFYIVITQSFATSIDALIVGISFAFIKVNIIETIVIIGFTTLLFSLSGFCIGKRYGKKISKHAEIIGGIILILLGIKILIEHIYFS
ncbi:MAG: manganese efflux pump [Chlorobi bacterium]|nr:manganese efflux pump [Chlorobiota bacterium]